MPQQLFVLFRDNIHPLCSPVIPGDTPTLYSSTLDLSLNFNSISTGHSHLLLPTFPCIKYWNFFTICFKGNSHFSSLKFFEFTPFISQILLQTHVEDIDSLLYNFLHPSISFILTMSEWHLCLYIVPIRHISLQIISEISHVFWFIYICIYLYIYKLFLFIEWRMQKLNFMIFSSIW